MIWVNEGRDQEARAILELAGIDSDKYRIWHHNSIYPENEQHGCEQAFCANKGV